MLIQTHLDSSVGRGEMRHKCGAGIKPFPWAYPTTEFRVLLPTTYAAAGNRISSGAARNRIAPTTAGMKTTHLTPKFIQGIKIWKKASNPNLQNFVSTVGMFTCTRYWTADFYDCDVTAWVYTTVFWRNCNWWCIFRPTHILYITLLTYLPVVFQLLFSCCRSVIS